MLSHLLQRPREDARAETFECPAVWCDPQWDCSKPLLGYHLATLSTSLSFFASQLIHLPKVWNLSPTKKSFITLLLPSSCILPSPNLQSIWATFYPSWTLGSLALFSTKMAPFKAILDSLIAKPIGFLPCLCCTHLTLPVPSILVMILSALPALILLHSLPLFHSLLLRAGLPRCSGKLVKNQGLQGCPHSLWMGRTEGDPEVCILTSSPHDSSHCARLGSCFGLWCFLRSDPISGQSQDSEMLGSGIVSISKPHPQLWVLSISLRDFCWLSPMWLQKGETCPSMSLRGLLELQAHFELLAQSTISGCPWDTSDSVCPNRTNCYLSSLKAPMQHFFSHCCKGRPCHKYPGQNWKPGHLQLCPLPSSPKPEILCWSGLQVSFSFSFLRLSHQFLVLWDPFLASSWTGACVLPEGWPLQHQLLPCQFWVHCCENLFRSQKSRSLCEIWFF